MSCRRTEYLPFSSPPVGEEEIAAVCDALRSGWITTGQRVQELERRFCDFLEAEAALALSSCTAGLHLALLAHGIGMGDEVITTTLTFAATVNVIEHVGARPVLVDVERDTLNIDPVAVRSAVTPKTRAVMAVHYAGHPADLESLDAICEEYGLALIEDAAHALPAASAVRRIGSGSNLTAFSFYATKNITTGEGGMLTGSADLVERVRPLALHGMSRDAWKRYTKGAAWHYDIAAPGYKYNMTDPAAAMGLVQLRRLDAFQARRRSLVNLYEQQLGDLAVIELPAIRRECESALHLYPVRLHLESLDIDRDNFLAELLKLNIGTSVHFIPVHEHSYYRRKYGYKPDDFPVADDAFRRLFSLPLHPGLTDEDIIDVAAAVRDVVHRHGR